MGVPPDEQQELENIAEMLQDSLVEALVGKGDLVLMAHHGDDQAETVLFRMLRGSGLAGLAGMPASRELGAATLVRPLLAFERAELERWARVAGLSWVDDPSNTDQRFDRNFLRHTVLPLLRDRWPGLNRRLRHTAARVRWSGGPFDFRALHPPPKIGTVTPPGVG